jgi:hypothetical protein
MTALAPIVLFIFKRPDHLRSTISSLKRCKEFADSKVIVFGDGPKDAADRTAVEAARRVAQQQLGTNAEYRFAEKNAGLASSIISGVNEVTRRLGRAIVLEDDLEFSPRFLTFMNSALHRYETEKDVYQVSGQLFDTPEFYDRKAAVFLPFTSSWGWGTWRRSWERFDPSAAGWECLAKDSVLRHRFNLGGTYDFSTMLERQMTGHGDSWAIRWYWSVFRNDGVACFPPVSLVRNTGMDGSGTHGRGRLRRFNSSPDLRQVGSIELPGLPTVDHSDFDHVKKAIWRQNGGWLGAATDVLRRRLFKLTGRHM